MPLTRPLPDDLCQACRTITGEALLDTGPFQAGTIYMHYNEFGELEEETISPNKPGTYLNVFLERPAITVKTCAACQVFQRSVYGGITVSGPTRLRICLSKDRDQLEVEDVGKVERESEKAEREGRMANLDGRGWIMIFADYGEHSRLIKTGY